MKKILLIVTLGSILFASCKKNEDNKASQNTPKATDLGALTIPSTFNWSNSFKGNLNVTVQAGKNFQIEGQRIQLIDELDNILETTTITGTKCSFYLNLPQTEGSYYLYAPSTGDKLQIKGSGNINFKLHTDLENDLEGILANATPANQRKASARKSTMSNLLTNGDFSQNAFSSST